MEAKTFQASVFVTCLIFVACNPGAVFPVDLFDVCLDIRNIGEIVS
jgi:hypothetical protein